MANKADESPVQENVEEETPEEVVDELEQASDVSGDLVSNPVIEEATDESEDEAPQTAEAEEPPEDTPPEEDAVEVPEKEPDEPEVKAEKDETGVYEPITAPDPGEFQPKRDYSFEITTTDGKTVKLRTQDEADKFAERLDSEEGLLTASQFAKFTRGVAKMDGGLERERADYEADKEKFDTQQAQEKVRDDQVLQWNNEIKYLRGKGLIPTPSKDHDADWLGNKDAEGVKEAMQIFDWMDKENQARRGAGINEVTSAVDAFQMMKAEQIEQSASDEKTRAGDTRRAKGAMVRGNSAHIPMDSPKNSIVGEGGNLRDLIYEAQNNL